MPRAYCTALLLYCPTALLLYYSTALLLYCSPALLILESYYLTKVGIKRSLIPKKLRGMYTESGNRVELLCAACVCFFFLLKQNQRRRWRSALLLSSSPPPVCAKSATSRVFRQSPRPWARTSLRHAERLHMNPPSNAQRSHARSSTRLSGLPWCTGDGSGDLDKRLALGRRSSRWS